MASTPSKSRFAFLDITKGVLVILMIVYHSLNYTSEYRLAFRLLSFLPPSFIFITGFLISFVYAARYEAGETGLISRLLTRGVKLIVLFTVLNVTAQFVRSPVYGMSVGVGNFFEKSFEIYILGAGGYAASFDVLLPIAYLLFLGPTLLAAAQARPLILTLVAITIVFVCLFLDHNGRAINNLNLLSAGLIGVLAGRFMRRPQMLAPWRWMFVVAYAVYFPFGLYRGHMYIVQLFGAAIALALIASFAVRHEQDRRWQHLLVRIGQYSLLSYIAQIAILQVLSRFFARPHPLSLEGILQFLLTFFGTVLIVEITDWVRKRSWGARALYQSIFA